MFIGHALIAFTILGYLGHRWGWESHRTLLLGGVAACFATLPDIDIIFAFLAVSEAILHGEAPSASLFWGLSTATHRGVTHIPVLGVLIAGVLASLTAHLTQRASYRSAVGGVGLSALAAGLVLHSHGLRGLLVLGVFLSISLLFTVAVVQTKDISPKAIFGTAVIGFVSHPFGDVFTGTPPHILYPVPLRILDTRVLVATDPTVNLVLVFLLELATVWGALAIFLHVTNDARVRDATPTPVAVSGVAYIVALPVIPEPTIDSAYLFVYSLLGVWFGATVLSQNGRAAISNRRLSPIGVSGVSTGLATVTLAAITYLVAYVVVG